MSDNTGIEWTDATWNPVTGCTEVSPGCDHCYAKTFAERWRGVPGHHFEQGFDVVLRPERLHQPLRWKKPRRIFVNSMSDLFHDAIPDDYIARVWAVMALAPQHTFQVLTKRHGRMRSLLNSDRFDDLFAEALYTTEDSTETPSHTFRQRPRRRTDGLSRLFASRVPAVGRHPHPLRCWRRRPRVRFLSCEPLLGPVDLKIDRCMAATPCRDSGCLADVGGIDWVIAGGESGRGARPMLKDWVRSLRDQCEAAEVPFLFKQWGEWAPTGTAPNPSQGNGRRLNRERRCLAPDGTAVAPFQPGRFMDRVGKKAAGRELDGRTWDEFPTQVVMA